MWKVAVVDDLRAKMGISHHHLVYVGDGSSDVHVMLHVNRLDGLTIAVSENKYITQIATRTILSDDALSLLVPILEELSSGGIRRVYGRCSKRTDLSCRHGTKFARTH